MTEPLPLAARLADVAARLGRLEPDVDDTAAVTAHLADGLEVSWAALAPRRFTGARLSDLDPGRLGQLEAWNRESNIVMLGPVGSGKSHAAWATLAELHRTGRKVAGGTCAKVLDSLRPDRDRRYDITADVLLIDDVGAEQSTSWTVEQLGSILNCRWEDMAPTIVTSNLDPDALARWLGERAWSRLAGGALVMGLAGDDRRFESVLGS